ncbi:MAG: hypothetical protein WED07_02950 [Candidatus Freyarchaeum deiterrae]
MLLLPLQEILGLTGITLIIIIIWCVLAVVLAIWVYRDASSRRMMAVLWLIIVLITGLIGLIIYLIVRD